MGFSSTVLHTVPASPPQYVEPAWLIAFCMNTAVPVFPSCPMFPSFLLAPKGPAQRVTALHAGQSADKVDQIDVQGDVPWLRKSGPAAAAFRKTMHANASVQPGSRWQASGATQVGSYRNT
jgi:hypothetical protein